MKKWKKQSLKKALFSAGGRVFLLLLCLCSALSFCSPVNAYTFSSAKKIPILGVQFTAPAIRANQLIYNGSNSSVQFDTVTTGVQSWTYTSLFFQLNFNQTIPANSLVSVSMSVSHSNPNDAPVCFSGDFGQQLVFCDISGDNQNYTITGLFFFTSAYSNLKLYSYTSNANITLGTPAISVGPVVASTVNEEGLSSAELQGLITQIDYVVQNTDVTRNGVRQQLNDIDSDIDGLSTQLGYIVDNTDVTRNGVRQQLDDIIDAINAQMEQQEEQYEQEKQEEADREEQGQEDSETAQGLFSFSVFNPFGGIFGLFSDGCVSIPTIGGMLNKPDATYCPWFSGNIRSILTPVLGLSASMLLFGFVVRWLSGNSGDIYGARNYLGKELS